MDSGSIWQWNWHNGEATKIGSQCEAGFALAAGGQVMTFNWDEPRGRWATIYDASHDATWWQQKAIRPSPSEESVVLSPDGQMCAVGTYGTHSSDPDRYHVTVLDLLGKRTIYETRHHVRAIANGGQFIVVEPWGKRKLSVLETATVREIAGIRKTSRITSSTRSPDGRTVCSADSQGRVYLWNVSTGQLMAQLDTAPGEIDTLRFRPMAGPCGGCVIFHDGREKGVNVEAQLPRCSRSYRAARRSCAAAIDELTSPSFNRVLRWAQMPLCWSRRESFHLPGLHASTTRRAVYPRWPILNVRHPVPPIPSPERHSRVVKMDRSTRARPSSSPFPVVRRLLRVRLFAQYPAVRTKLVKNHFVLALPDFDSFLQVPAISHEPRVIDPWAFAAVVLGGSPLLVTMNFRRIAQARCDRSHR